MPRGRGRARLFPVDRHDRAVDEACLGREQVSDDGRHLLRPADAAERMQAARLLVDLLPFVEQRFVPLGGDRAQSDGVRADSVRPVVNGERAGEPLDRRFGGRVGQRARHWALSLVGRDVDDRPGAAAGQEVANGGRATGHRKSEIDRDQLEQLARRSVVKRRIAEDRCVVDPAGEGSRSLRRIGGMSGDGFIAGVTCHSRDVWILACPCQCVGVDVDDDHVTFSCKPRGDRSTDPARTAGHDMGTHLLRVLRPSRRRPGDWRPVPGLVQPELAAAGQPDRGHETEPLVLDRPGDHRSASAQLTTVAPTSSHMR